MRITRAIVTLFAVIAAGSGSVFAKGDPAAGKSQSASCTTCHGQGGVSPTDAFPNLAGQGQAYLVKQLKAYRDGTRTDPLMGPVAKALSDENIDNISAYFSSLNPATAKESASQPVAAVQIPHPPIVPSPEFVVPHAHTTRRYWADQMPEGDSKAIISVKCQFCHDLQRAIAFARPMVQWREVVEDMQGRGSPLTAEEIPAMVEYLTKNFGLDSPTIRAPGGAVEVGMKPCTRDQWPKGSKDFRTKWKGSYNIWVSNQQGGDIDIVDPVTLKTVNKITCVSAPDRIEFSRDGNTAYAPDRVEHNLTVIDTRTGAIKAKIPLIARPNMSVLSRDYKKLYMSIWPVRPDEKKRGYIQVVDTKSLKVVKTIDTQGGVHDPWMSQDGKILLGMSPPGRFMNVYDTTQDDKLLYSCCTEAEIGTMVMEANPDGSTKRFVISYGGYHGLVVIDPNTGQELQRIKHPTGAGSETSSSEIYLNGVTTPQTGGGSGFHGGEISADGKNLWVISGSIVYRYELPSLKPLGSVHLALIDQVGNSFTPAVEGTWLTISPDGQTVWASRPGRNLLSVIDVKTMKEVALIPTGEYPLHISVWPRGTP